MCRLIWRASVGRGVGEACLEGGRSHRQVCDELEWYGVVLVHRGQEVGVWVPSHSAVVYAAPVRRVGQGLLQSACARVRASGVAVGALGRDGVWYRV